MRRGIDRVSIGHNLNLQGKKARVIHRSFWVSVKLRLAESGPVPMACWASASAVPDISCARCLP
jgi:hypothetical protein